MKSKLLLTYIYGSMKSKLLQINQKPMRINKKQRNKMTFLSLPQGGGNLTVYFWNYLIFQIPEPGFVPGFIIKIYMHLEIYNTK